jgi:hypothetical protein
MYDDRKQSKEKAMDVDLAQLTDAQVRDAELIHAIIASNPQVRYRYHLPFAMPRLTEHGGETRSVNLLVVRVATPADLKTLRARVEAIKGAPTTFSPQA